MPTIDILIPNLNSEKTLTKTLFSIKNQTFKDFRLVFVDNLSDDTSIEIFKQLMSSHNFEIFINSTRLSPSQNFNKCLSLIKSEFFCLMHSDDEYEPNYLDVMLKSMISNPEIDMSFCDSNIIDYKSKKIFSTKNFIKRYLFPPNNKLISGLDGLLWNAYFDKIICPTMFFKSSVINNYGIFNTDFEGVFDWEYIFRILKGNGKIFYVNKNLFNYRVHKNQQSFSQTQSFQKYFEQKSFIHFYSEYLRINFNYYLFQPFICLKICLFKDIFLDLLSFNFSTAYNRFKLYFKLFY